MSSDKMKDMLDELIAFDPELQDQKDSLKKCMKAFIDEKPNNMIDVGFENALRVKLVEKCHQIKEKKATMFSFFPNLKTLLIFSGSAAVSALVFFLVLHSTIDTSFQKSESVFGEFQFALEGDDPSAPQFALEKPSYIEVTKVNSEAYGELTQLPGTHTEDEDPLLSIPETEILDLAEDLRDSEWPENTNVGGMSPRDSIPDPMLEIRDPFEDMTEDIIPMSNGSDTNPSNENPSMNNFALTDNQNQPHVVEVESLQDNSGIDTMPPPNAIYNPVVEDDVQPESLPPALNPPDDIVPEDTPPGIIEPERVAPDTYAEQSMALAMPPAPVNTPFTYEGSQVAVPADMLPVYKMNPFIQLSSVSTDNDDGDYSYLFGAKSNSSTSHTIELKNNLLGNNNIQKYTVSIQPERGHITIKANVAWWDSMKAECNKNNCYNTAPLTDKELLAIANTFFNDHSIPAYSFGTPEIKYDVVKSKAAGSMPEEIVITYPYVLDGLTILSQSGEKEGMRVVIDTHYKHVKALTVNRFNFESSLYNTASFDQISSSAEKGGSNTSYLQISDMTRSFALGTPELVLMHISVQKGATQEEIIVYTYSFPVLDKGGNSMIPDTILVPLVLDLL